MVLLAKNLPASEKWTFSRGPFLSITGFLIHNCKENGTHTRAHSHTPLVKDGSTLWPEFSIECFGAGWNLILGTGNLRPGKGQGAGQATQLVVAVFSGDAGGCFCRLLQRKRRSRVPRTKLGRAGATLWPGKIMVTLSDKGQAIGGLIFKAQFCSLCCR